MALAVPMSCSTSPKVFSLQQQKSVDLSWRVSVLPFLEQANLFNALDKDADANGPKNMAFSNTQIPVYQLVSRGPGIGVNSTFVQNFTGPSTIFPTLETKARLQEITDGTSNTFLTAEALAPVPWMQAKDMAMAPVAQIPLNQGAFTVGMADGSVRRVQRNAVADDMLRKLIDPRDGNPIPDGWENGGR